MSNVHHCATNSHILSTTWMKTSRVHIVYSSNQRGTFDLKRLSQTAFGTHCVVPTITSTKAPRNRGNCWNASSRASFGHQLSGDGEMKKCRYVTFFVLLITKMSFAGSSTRPQGSVEHRSSVSQSSELGPKASLATNVTGTNTWRQLSSACIANITFGAAELRTNPSSHFVLRCTTRSSDSFSRLHSPCRSVLHPPSIPSSCPA